jgi:peptidoglycan/LPS O-acetylase OafA/YrhL
MITGGPVFPPHKPRRKRPQRAVWIILALILCAAPLAGVFLPALPTFWGLLVFVVLLFLLGVVKLVVLPARATGKAGED